MKLHRLKNEHIESSVDFQRLDENTIRLDFMYFSQKSSYMRIEIDWSDVEHLIEAFSKLKVPQAGRIQRALTLANAVDGLNSGHSTLNAESA